MQPQRGRLLFVGAAAILYAVCAAAQSPPSLGIARSFAAFGASGVENHGGTRLSGNAGASPGRPVRDLPASAFILGEIITDSGTLRQVERDSAAAYADLAARQCALPVYCVTSPLSSMTLTGDPTTIWIFKVAGPLETLPDSAILLRGGATYTNVFWQVDGSVTLGERSAFVGTILARGDINFGRDVSMSGHALSLTGTVRLDWDDISCCDPIEFSAPLPKQQIGERYNETITLSGGTPPYKVSFFDGTLPEGWTLSETGTLSGPRTGSFSFTALAVDHVGCSSIHTYTVCDTITVTVDPLPNAKLCEFFTRKIVASGGTPPYTYTVTGLPDGLSLSGDTISGTPKSPGCFPITIEVTDALGCKGSLTVTLCVDCCIALPSLPTTAPACMPFTANLTPSCGTPPYVFTVNDLPPWLSGPPPILSATRPPPGPIKFTVKVVDATGYTDTRTYLIDFVPAPPPDPPLPIELPKGFVCTPYDSGPLAGVLVDPAALPPGLAFENSDLKGLPTQCGRFCFKRATGDVCVPPQEYCVTIELPPLALSPLSLHACAVTNQRVTPDFCIPFTCTVTSGTLPAGMTLDNCTLQGTPQLGGKYDFCISAVADSCPSITRCYSETVSPAALTLTPPAGLLPAATVGMFFSQTFTATPGTHKYLIGAPEIPPGLTFNQTTGKLSGVPTVTGRYNFAVYVLDDDVRTCTSVVYTLDVGPVGPLPMGIPALSMEWMVFMVIALIIAAVIAIGKSS